MGSTLYVSEMCGACESLKEEAKEKGISFKGIKTVDCDKNPKKCNDKGIEFAPTLVTSSGKKIEGVDQILKALKTS